VILAYEIALRALSMRDLESTRFFVEIARTLRDIEPRKSRLSLPFGKRRT